MNLNEPVAPPAIPDPPAFLSPAALAEWNRCAPLFKDSGLLSLLDRDALGAYCQAIARRDEAEAQLAAGGMTRVLPSGIERASPWLAIANDCTKIILRIAGEFGLTPASRTRVQVDKTEDDDFERYLQGALGSRTRV